MTMLQTLSVVLERNTVLSGDFATEPYEVAWAREARWFVRAIEMRGAGARFEARTQISPDGLHWCDLDEYNLILGEPGMVTRPVREFGGWLRLKGTVAGEQGVAEGTGVKVLICLVLKS